MSQRVPYLLVEFYYPMIDNGSGGDLVGDACLSAVLQPLTKGLNTRQGVEGYEFMRYSLDGYHLRIKFHGELNALQRLADEGVRPALQTFAECHAKWLAHDMTLGDFGQRLLARLGKQGDPLREGGDFAVRMARDADDLFESDYIRAAYLKLSRHMCDLVLLALELNLNRGERRALARLMMMQLLQATGMRDEGLHYLSTFAARQWQGYFNIDPAQIAACQADAASSSAGFSAFLSRVENTEAVAKALPARIRAGYCEKTESMVALMPDLVELTAEGGASNHTALRVLSLVHLAHNRLGLNILQEITFAELAVRYFCGRLDPEAASRNSEWVDRNLANYLANSGEVAI